MYHAKQIGAALLFLMMLLGGCARQPVVQPIQCQHPAINPATNAGLAQAVADYWTALEECNKLNGK